jgi:hypothetical protein
MLSLDDDVARLLAKEVRRSGSSFKAIVNHYLRLGLMASSRQNRRTFKVKPRNLGLPATLGYDNVEELLDRLEGADVPLASGT